MEALNLLEDFRTVLHQRYPMDGVNMTMGDWLLANTHYKGNAFSFEDYEFQKAIADDMHPNLACIKCSQIGLTEVQIRKFLAWLKRNRGTTGIFTLPDEKIYKRISKMRIRPLMESEPVFNVRMNGDAKPARSMDMYQIDESFAVISGLTESDATSTSADILFHDEVDLSDQKMLALSQSRLQNSKWKITQAFSTPKYPGYGIDGKWQTSDQHEYFLRCEACNHHQIPLFEPKFLCLPNYKGPDIFTMASDEEINQIDFQNAHLRCERCSKPLDLNKPELRQWVPRHPSRDLTRGYRVRPFSTNRIGIRYIFSQLINQRRQDGVGGFYNTVLGEPYVDGKAQLSEDEIRKCMKSPTQVVPSDDMPCFIGIDVGDTCHIVVGTVGYESEGVFLLRSVPVSKLLEVLDKIMARYNIVGGLIDQYPYSPTAEAVRDRYNGRILPCGYRGTAPISIIKDEQDNVTHVHVNRTMVLDKVVDVVRAGKLEVNGYGAQESLFIEHLRNMVREEVPEKPAQWIKLDNQDHYFHAMAFFLASPRVHEFYHDYINQSMVVSTGIFSLDELTSMPSGPNPDFQPTPEQPLSVRARMKGPVSLWQFR